MDSMQFEMVMLHGGMKAHGAEKNGGERERERECVCVLRRIILLLVQKVIRLERRVSTT